MDRLSTHPSGSDAGLRKTSQPAPLPSPWLSSMQSVWGRTKVLAQKQWHEGAKQVRSWLADPARPLQRWVASQSQNPILPAFQWHLGSSVRPAQKESPIEMSRFQNLMAAAKSRIQGWVQAEELHSERSSEILSQIQTKIPEIYEKTLRHAMDWFRRFQGATKADLPYKKRFSVSPLINHFEHISKKSKALGVVQGPQITYGDHTLSDETRDKLDRLKKMIQHLPPRSTRTFSKASDPTPMEERAIALFFEIFGSESTKTAKDAIQFPLINDMFHVAKKTQPIPTILRPSAGVGEIHPNPSPARRDGLASYGLRRPEKEQAMIKAANLKPSQIPFYHEYQSGPYCQTTCVNNYLGVHLFSPELAHFLIEEIAQKKQSVDREVPIIGGSNRNKIHQRLQELCLINSERWGVDPELLKPILKQLDLDKFSFKERDSLAHADQVDNFIQWLGENQKVERLLLSSINRGHPSAHIVALRRASEDGSRWVLLDGNQPPVELNLRALLVEGNDDFEWLVQYPKQSDGFQASKDLNVQERRGNLTLNSIRSSAVSSSWVMKILNTPLLPADSEIMGNVLSYTRRVFSGFLKNEDQIDQREGGVIIRYPKISELLSSDQLNVGDIDQWMPYRIPMMMKTLAKASEKVPFWREKSMEKVTELADVLSQDLVQGSQIFKHELIKTLSSKVSLSNWAFRQATTDFESFQKKVKKMEDSGIFDYYVATRLDRMLKELDGSSEGHKLSFAHLDKEKVRLLFAEKKRALNPRFANPTAAQGHMAMEEVLSLQKDLKPQLDRLNELQQTLQINDMAEQFLRYLNQKPEPFQRLQQAFATHQLSESNLVEYWKVFIGHQKNNLQLGSEEAKNQLKKTLLNSPDLQRIKSIIECMPDNKGAPSVMGMMNFGLCDKQFSPT